MSIPLISFFKRVHNCSYVIVKKSHGLPQYYPGSDIDILCNDQAVFARHILAEGNKLLSDGYSIEVGTNPEGTHTKIDFYKDDALELRFDIHQGLPPFRRVNIRREYESCILADRKESTLQDEERGEETIVYTPSPVDDLLLRYIEYHEWFARRPDKLKHAEYVEEKLANDPNMRNMFFDRLHQFVSVLERDDISPPPHSFIGKNRSNLSWKKNWKRILKNRAPKLFRLLRFFKRVFS